MHSPGGQGGTANDPFCRATFNCHNCELQVYLLTQKVESRTRLRGDHRIMQDIKVNFLEN